MTATSSPTDQRRASAAWGRTPGLPPPLPEWAPLAWFVALASVLAFVSVALVRPPGPLDDPDPADQRDGLLLSGPVVPERVLGLNFGGEPVVLLFLRRLPGAEELADWATAVPEQARVRVVLPAPTDTEVAVPTVVDPLNRLARAVGMPEPVDGGRPVGYAVVDSDRVVRYATLDPDYLTNGFELETIVGSVA
jgi:hypothetical protein